MSKLLLTQLKIMKFNLSIGLTLLLFVASNMSVAQKRGKKGKSTSSDVLNMTFEKLQDDERVSELGAITILDNGVFSPTEISADLFQKGAGSIAGVPNNVFGTEQSDVDGGDLYAGFVAYRPGRESSLRSYITIPFIKGKGNTTLSKGLKYCVQFKISLAESSKFACNNIGAYFTKEAPSSSNSGIINAPENLIRGKNNRIHQGFFGWDQVCEIYTAKGDEKFITIGNFDKNDKNGKAFALQSTQPNYSRFAKDWTFGLRANISSSILISAEYHRINGTGWLSNLENTTTTQHWDLYTMMVSYYF